MTDRLRRNHGYAETPTAVETGQTPLDRSKHPERHAGTCVRALDDISFRCIGSIHRADMQIARKSVHDGRRERDERAIKRARACRPWPAARDPDARLRASQAAQLR